MKIDDLVAELIERKLRFKEEEMKGALSRFIQRQGLMGTEGPSIFMSKSWTN